MKRQKLISRVVIVALLMTFFTFPARAATGKSSMDVPGTFYEMSTSKNYNYADHEPVAKMAYGKASVGQLVISGSNLELSSYAGETAFGSTGNVSFSYVYDNSLLGTDAASWRIVEDKEKKVADQKLDSNILKGVLIIQRSYDGTLYENVANPVTNFFANNNSGRELYRTAGEDISKGVYLRFIFAYKTEAKTGKFLFIDQKESKRHVEVYDFYVVENSGIISIHNLSVDEELLEMDDYSQELLKHGETLENGSVTRDGFEIEKFAESYTVKVQRSGFPATYAKSGDKFTEDGKYTVTVRTKLGKSKSTTLYVFRGGADKGYSAYFGENIIQAERVFRDGDHPTYARGGRLLIRSVESEVPPLYGQIKNLDTGSIYTLNGSRNERSVPLEPGKYEVSLYNAKTSLAGSYYQYNFMFEVLGEDSAPYVNYHTLMQEQRLEDLQTKHYEVAYQTTGGGYIYVCFSLDSYEEALTYAREIEGRFVEEASDGGFYYKDIENPNRKIKYYDPLDLTNAREFYAAQNVEVGYFNANDKFTYQTYDDDLLSCLEDLSLYTSIKVFPSQKEKEKMCDRAPYINNFTFIQVSDYDVVSVVAIHNATGAEAELKFGTPVSQQLTASGEYTITETNKYGKTTQYVAYFLADCNTQMTWNIETDGVSSEVNVSANEIEDGQYEIEADSAYVSDIINVYDNWAIVTIKAPGIYSFEIKCLASEFKNLEFYKAGTYEIDFIDRLGNSFTVILHITGDLAYGDINQLNASYVEFYNALYRNPKNTDEDHYTLEELAAVLPPEEPEQIAPDVDNDNASNSGEAETSGDLVDGQNQKNQDDGVSGVVWPIIVTFIVIAGIVLAFVCRRKMKLEVAEAGQHTEDTDVEEDEDNV